MSDARHSLISLAVLALLGGCAVGPDYRALQAPAAEPAFVMPAATGGLGSAGAWSCAVAML